WTPYSLSSLPLLAARRRGSLSWWGLLWLLGRRLLRVVARAEEHARRVAVEIVHGAADVTERLAAVGHQRAGALVEILGKLADRLHREEQLAALLAAGQRVQPQHQIVGLAHYAVDTAHDGVDALGIARQRTGEGFEIMQRVLHRLLIVGDDPVDVLQGR